MEFLVFPEYSQEFAWRNPNQIEKEIITVTKFSFLCREKSKAESFW